MRSSRDIAVKYSVLSTRSDAAKFLPCPSHPSHMKYTRYVGQDMAIERHRLVNNAVPLGEAVQRYRITEIKKTKHVWGAWLDRGRQLDSAPTRKR